MIPRRIHGANRWMGAPVGWNPEIDGHCSHLAVRMSVCETLVFCESAWEPTPEDLDLLNKGGSVILRVVGGQPPVALYVEALIEEPANASND